MPEQDWRTDNWAGHKPTFWKYGRDYRNCQFPRTGKEAFGPLWDDAVPDEVTNDNLDNFLNFKLPMGAILLIILLIVILSFVVPGIRQVLVLLWDMLNWVWISSDEMFGRIIQNG